MTKSNKLFSWLGFGKKTNPTPTPAEPVQSPTTSTPVATSPQTESVVAAAIDETLAVNETPAAVAPVASEVPDTAGTSTAESGVVEVAALAPVVAPAALVNVEASSAATTTVQPTIAEPTVAEPTVAEPTVAEPTVAEPTVAEPTVAEPEIPEAGTTEPAMAESAVVGTTAADAVSVEPVFVQETVVEAAVVESAAVAPEIVPPATETPVVGESTMVEPEIIESQIAEPAIVEPAIVESKAVVSEILEPAIATAVPAAAEPALAAAAKAELPEPAEKKPGFFARLRQGLAKTSQNFGAGLASLFLGKKIDDDLYEELETQLLMADVGVDTTQKLIRSLTDHASRRQLKDAEALYDKLQEEMATLLGNVEQPLQLAGANGPYVILMVGVNGVGKTTTIGKLAQQFKQQGKSVMLAAGDTFRAAAVEQLQVWGDRNQIPVIAQHTGADSASVIFDAYQAAKARGVDVLIADTAGRLQNKAHLMEELKKIVRVMKKIDDAAPHEVMLTLDAGTGQNALSQAKLFHEAVQLTGITLTKLDGTAKGGVIFAIADQFSLPIRYIGVGESIDDLRVFNSKDFIKALFNREF